MEQILLKNISLTFLILALMTTFSNNLESIYYGVEKKELSNITGFPSAPHCSHVIQREDTGAILHTCTDRYDLVKNEDLIEPFHKYLVSKYGKNGVDVKVRTKNDTFFYVDFILKEIKGEVQVGDIINPVIEIGNSYNGMMKRFVKLGYHRLVCSNGMRAFSAEVSNEKKHFKQSSVESSTDWEKYLKVMLFKLENLLKDYDKHIERFRKLNERRLTHKELEELEVIIKKKTSYPKKLIEETGEIIQRENRLGLQTTAWLAYNAYNQLLFQEKIKLDEHIRVGIDFDVMRVIEDFRSS